METLKAKWYYTDSEFQIALVQILLVLLQQLKLPVRTEVKVLDQWGLEIENGIFNAWCPLES